MNDYRLVLFRKVSPEELTAEGLGIKWLDTIDGDRETIWSHYNHMLDSNAVVAMEIHHGGRVLARHCRLHGDLIALATP